MPFKKIVKGKNKGKFKSPSGKIFSQKQVKLYYVRGGTFDETIDKKAKKSKTRKNSSKKIKRKRATW